MADIYIRSCVNTDHRYCTSRKKTNRAERISPTPMLKSISEKMGISSSTNFHVNATLSMIQNTKNTTSTRPKLMSACTFLENRNRYLGTFILVKMGALSMSDVIPWPDDSLKYEKSKLPQNK